MGRQTLRSMMPRQWQGLSGSAMKVRIGCTAGSYVVLRRIRIALEHWDRMPLEFQEQSVGRHKNSGAPLGRDHEFDPPDLTRYRKRRRSPNSRERAYPSRRRGEQ